MTDNIIDIASRRKPGGGPPKDTGGFAGNGPPPPVLPQDDYKFYLVDKITGGELVHVRKGHLVVTQHNIVLFNQNQEMIWGLPNDSSICWFERLDTQEFDSAGDEDIESELTND